MAASTVSGSDYSYFYYIFRYLLPSSVKMKGLEEQLIQTTALLATSESDKSDFLVGT